MAADPVVRPASGQPGDVTLTGSGPRGVDIYLGASSPTVLTGQRLDQAPSAIPVNATGTAAVTLDAFTSAATGTQTGTGATGTAAVTLDGFTSAASGTETFTGTASVTLSDATSSATGTETISGTSATTLADSTSTASGTQAVNATGTAAITLDDFISSGVGSGGVVESPVRGGGWDQWRRPDPKKQPRRPAPLTGTATITLDNVTVSAAGTHTIDFDAELEQLLLVGAL